jgi:hypothetical protein
MAQPPQASGSLSGSRHWSQQIPVPPSGVLHGAETPLLHPASAPPSGGQQAGAAKKPVSQLPVEQFRPQAPQFDGS